PAAVARGPQNRPTVCASTISARKPAKGGVGSIANAYVVAETALTTTTGSGQERRASKGIVMPSVRRAAVWGCSGGADTSWTKPSATRVPMTRTSTRVIDIARGYPRPAASDVLLAEEKVGLLGGRWTSRLLPSVSLPSHFVAKDPSCSFVEPPSPPGHSP